MNRRPIDGMTEAEVVAEIAAIEAGLNAFTMSQGEAERLGALQAALVEYRENMRRMAEIAERN